MKKHCLFLLVCTLIVVLAAILGPVQPASAQGGCTTYHGSSLYYYYGDWVCAYSGVACTECSQPSSDCYYDSGNDVSACDFFPENRW